MRFSWLEGVSKKWKEILVIGKTFERDGKKYHMVGMTMEEETASLYIIEPYEEKNCRQSKKKRTQRQIIREQEMENSRYSNCQEFWIGKKKLCTQSGCSGVLSPDNYEEIKMFLDMMDAGWKIPEWLGEEDWDRLQLHTLTFTGLKRLPKYSPDMPIVIKHGRGADRHLLHRAKRIALEIGKPCSFQFTAHDGEKVQCYINDVILVDMWEEAGKKFDDAKYREHFTEEQLREIERQYYEALRQNCPEGMCYIGIEYECSKDINLQFDAREFLDSYPKTYSGSASFLVMMWKPDRKTGMHGLPLKGGVINMPFSPDTTTVAAELLFYMEMTQEWEERVF